MKVFTKVGLHTLFTEVGNKEIDHIIIYNGKNEVETRNSEIQIRVVEADRKIKEPTIRIGNYVYSNVLYLEAETLEVKVVNDPQCSNRFQVATNTVYDIELKKSFTDYYEREKTKLTLSRLNTTKTESGEKLTAFAEEFNISEYVAKRIIEAYNIF